MKSNYIQGKYTYGEVSLIGGDSGAILKIGSFCSLATGVIIFLGGNHRPDWITTYPFNVQWGIADVHGHPATKGNVVIGNDVWIGQGAVILSGVTIGDGAVIGAYSVVSKDIAPYEIWCGNPAEYKKTRFPQSVITKLLSIAWWDWSDDNIRAAAPLLQSGDMKSFFEYAEGIKGQ